MQERDYWLGFSVFSGIGSKRFCDLLENEPLLFDEIVKRSGFDSSKLGMLLSLMELKGMVSNSSEGIALIN